MSTAPVTETAPAAMVWSDAFLIGYDPMDNIHQEFVELLGFLLQASQEQIPALMEALAKHTREHFASENAWMEASQFPPRQCHIDEHAAVLASIDEVRALVAEKNYDHVPSLAQALAEWFPGHADHLDSALAHWMCKRSLGGKPVVIRRNIALR